MSDQNNQPVESRHIHGAGAQNGEVAGPGGANMPGGEVTPPQDADAALDESHARRERTGQVEEQQQAGKIGQQTINQNPTAGDPENGLPTESPVESESSGVPQNEGGADGDAKKNADVDKSDGTAEELAEAKSRLLHLTADFENFKRQAARRETEARERAVRSVLEDLLPVLDNFERAVAAAQNSSDVQSLRTGVEFILQQLKETIKNHGVEPIEASGQTFDPTRHEAIEQVESEQEPGTVVDDVQRGYIYKGNVLRPSRVRVAK